MINIGRLIKSFRYARKGLWKIIREEQNLKIQLGLAAMVFFSGAVFRINRWEWCFIILAASQVIMMEALNSAVERVVDVLRPRINDYAKEIKDITAAAVMISSFFAVITGLIIFLPYIISFFGYFIV